MKISDNGDLKSFTKYDVFIRQLLVFSKKLLDEDVNLWFREYYKKHLDEEVEDFNRKLCNNLQRKYKYRASDYNILIMKAQGLEFSSSKADATYSIKNKKDGEVVKFDTYNGYWYTASDEGKDRNLVLFDYGDFYCMGNVFPLATYFVVRTQEKSKELMNDNG